MSTQFIQIQLASPNEIARWSQRSLPTGENIGEILKADTINYLSLIHISEPTRPY